MAPGYNALTSTGVHVFLQTVAKVTRAVVGANRISANVGAASIVCVTFVGVCQGG